MIADTLFQQLRELIDERGISLAKLAKRSEVPYFRIYRFFVNDRPLNVEDTNKLSVFLTGKSAIQLPDSNDQEL